MSSPGSRHRTAGRRAERLPAPCPSGRYRAELKQDTDSGKLIIRKLPGRPKAGEVTLTRGLTGDYSFEKWIKDSRFGKVSNARKGGAIIVFDLEGTAVKRYKLINARLKTLKRGSLKLGDTSVLTEKLILTHDGCEAGEA